MSAISYFFTLQSPWSYIGHAAFARIAAKHGAAIDYRPVQLGKIFAESGGLPLAKRHPARQRYRMLELQRWRLKRGLTMHLRPAHWPFDPSLADRIVITLAANDAGAVETVLPRFYAGIFEREEKLADEATLLRLLDEAKLDAVAILGRAKSEVAGATYEANTGSALGLGVIGAPTYVLNGEIFWGQDRLELLDDALASGRTPFVATA